jgi:hypothetical protein
MTKKLLTVLFDKIDIDIDFNADSDSLEFANFYWFGLHGMVNWSQKSWVIFFYICRYSIYKFKLRQNFPSGDGFLREICHNLSKAISANKKFKKTLSLIPELTWFSRAIG